MRYRVLVHWRHPKDLLGVGAPPSELLGRMRDAVAAWGGEVELDNWRAFACRRTLASVVPAPPVTVARRLARGDAETLRDALRQREIPCTIVADHPFFWGIRTFMYTTDVDRGVPAALVFSLLGFVAFTLAAGPVSRMALLHALMFVALGLWGAFLGLVKWKFGLVLVGRPAWFAPPASWDGEVLRIAHQEIGRSVIVRLLAVVGAMSLLLVLFTRILWVGAIAAALGVLWVAGLWRSSKKPFSFVADAEKWVLSGTGRGKIEGTGRVEDLVAIDWGAPRNRTEAEQVRGTSMRLHTRDGSFVVPITKLEWVSASRWRDSLSHHPSEISPVPPANDLPAVPTGPLSSRFGWRSRVLATDPRFTFALIHENTPSDAAGYSIVSVSDAGSVLVTRDHQPKDGEKSGVRFLRATGDFEGDAAAHQWTFQRLHGPHLSTSSDTVLKSDWLQWATFSRRFQVVTWVMRGVVALAIGALYAFLLAAEREWVMKRGGPSTDPWGDLQRLIELALQ